MDEEFITQGLALDRYLKAEKLVHRFEEEIQGSFEEFCNRVIEANSDLFEDSVTFGERAFGAGSGQTLATIRAEIAMNRVNDDGRTLRLNVALEWVEPGEQGEDSPSSDSLCYLLYKIQHGSETRFETVQQRTESRDGWDAVRFGEDQWYHPSKHAPGIVYIPVEDGPQVTNYRQTLEEHFTQEYAPEIRG